MADMVAVKKGRKPSEVSYEALPEYRRLIQIDDLRPDAVRKYCPPNPEEVFAETTDVVIAWDGANAGTSNFGLTGVIGSTLAALRPIRSDVDTAYLGHFLRSKTAFLRQNCKGATVPHIDGRVLASLDVPLPPVPEQRRIADILDHVDALRAKRRAAITYLDPLTQSIFLQLFRGEDSSKWTPLPLPSCYWFQEGPGVRNWQFTERGVKLLNVGNIEKNGTLNLGKTDKHLAEEEAYGKYRHFLVDPGDLVIASSGISFDQDGMLRTRGAFVSLEHLPLCMNTSTVRFKAIDGISDLRFLRAWLGSGEFRSQITKRVTGSAQQNFGPSHLRSLIITLPPLSVQEHFATKVEAVDQLRRSQQAGQHGLDTLVASLQQVAFRGEL